MELDETIRRKLYISFIAIGICFPLAIFLFLQFFLIKSFAKADIRVDASRITVPLKDNWETLARGSQINSFRVIQTAITEIKDTEQRNRAHEMIDSLDGYRMRVEGEGDYVRAVASRKKDTYMLLLVNYDKKNQNKEVVPFTISKLANGTYTATIQSLGGLALKTEGVPTEDGSIKKTLFMKPNQITLIKLQKEE